MIVCNYKDTFRYSKFYVFKSKNLKTPFTVIVSVFIKQYKILLYIAGGSKPGFHAQIF